MYAIRSYYAKNETELFYGMAEYNTAALGA